MTKGHTHAPLPDLYLFFTAFRFSPQMSLRTGHSFRRGTITFRRLARTAQRAVPTLPLSLPVLDLFMVFVRGNLGDGTGELGWADGMFDLTAQAARQGMELRGGE